MADVTYLYPRTDQPIPAARVLEAALDGAHACTEVLVLGCTAAGDFYAASSTGDSGLLLWWCERFKHALLSGEYA